MNKNRLLVHIGLGKTGTSFLQNKIFPYLTQKNVLYFDEHQSLQTKSFIDEYLMMGSAPNKLSNPDKIIPTIKSLQQHSLSLDRNYLGLRHKLHIRK